MLYLPEYAGRAAGGLSIKGIVKQKDAASTIALKACSVVITLRQV